MGRTGLPPPLRLIAFLAAVTRPDARPGLRQGSSLSPLLLNLYLHHHLDRPWRRAHPDIPLLRFADDILLLCRTPKQARKGYETLVDLLRPAGFGLKESCGDAVRFVSCGEGVRWMGFGIDGRADGMGFTATAEGWDRLGERLDAAQQRPNAPLAAVAALAGWMADKAPCHPHTATDRAYTRMRRLAAGGGSTRSPTRPR